MRKLLAGLSCFLATFTPFFAEAAWGVDLCRVERAEP